MGFEDIPEDRVESFPCECGGNITKIGENWYCDKCDFERVDTTKEPNSLGDKYEKFERQ